MTHFLGTETSAFPPWPKNKKGTIEKDSDSFISVSQLCLGRLSLSSFLFDKGTKKETKCDKTKRVENYRS